MPNPGSVGVDSFVVRFHLECVKRLMYCPSVSWSEKSTSSCTKWSHGIEIGALELAAPRKNRKESPNRFTSLLSVALFIEALSAFDPSITGSTRVFAKVPAKWAVGSVIATVYGLITLTSAKAIRLVHSD